MNPIATDEGLSQKRILIADDTVSGRALLRYILEGSGYVVAEAADGQQVLDSIAGFGPDLIVLDLHIPKLDGRTVAIALRKHHGVWQPIVALTPASTQTVPEEIFKAGFSAYLIKPIDPELLRRCVAHLLGGNWPQSSVSQID